MKMDKTYQNRCILNISKYPQSLPIDASVCEKFKTGFEMLDLDSVSVFGNEASVS